MLVLIDNYDSFTWNLVHYFGQLGPEVRVYRNDEITPEAVLDLKPAESFCPLAPAIRTAPASVSP